MNDANAKVSSACCTNVTNSKKARDADYEIACLRGLLAGTRASLVHTQNSEDAAKECERKALEEKKAAQDELKALTRVPGHMHLSCSIIYFAVAIDSNRPANVGS